MQANKSPLFHLECHHFDSTQQSLTVAKVFSVSSLCNKLPSCFVGEVYCGKCQCPSLLQNLSSDEYVLSYFGSVHVSVTRRFIFSNLIFHKVDNMQ